MKAGARNSGILLVYNGETGRTQETETFTCGHCGTVGMIRKDPQLTDDDGFCFKCCKLLCKRPHCHTNCAPYKAKVT